MRIITSNEKVLDNGIPKLMSACGGRVRIQVVPKKLKGMLLSLIGLFTERERECNMGRERERERKEKRQTGGEMHGRMHPNLRHVTILFVGSSSLAYFMMTHPLSIASKLPIKASAARQLPTNTHTMYTVNTNENTYNHMYVYIHFIRTFGSTLIILRSRLFLNNRPVALSAITYVV